MLRRLSKRPDQWSHANRDSTDEDRQRQAETQIVAEAITAQAVNHQISLITNRRGKTRRGTHNHRNNQW